MNPVGGSKIFIGLRVASKSEVTASDFVGQDWVEIGGLTNIGQLGDSQEVVSQSIISGGRTRQTKGTVVGQVMENTFLPIWNDPGQARFLAAVKSCNTYAFKVEWSQGCDDDPLVDLFYGFALPGSRAGGDSNTAQLRNWSIAVDSNVVNGSLLPQPPIPDPLRNLILDSDWRVSGSGVFTDPQPDGGHFVTTVSGDQVAKKVNAIPGATYTAEFTSNRVGTLSPIVRWGQNPVLSGNYVNATINNTSPSVRTTTGISPTLLNSTWFGGGLGNVGAELDMRSIKLLQTAPSVAIAGFGDSIGQGTFPLAGAMFSPTKIVAASALGGQKENEIACRQGGLPLIITVPGDEIPASGTASGVTLSTPVYTSSGFSIFRNANTLSGTFTCKIAGVDCTLVADSLGAVTLNRDVAGSAVACPAGTNVYLDISQNGRTLTQWWISGRNGIGTFSVAETAAIDAAMVRYLPHSRFLFGSILPSTGDGDLSTAASIERLAKNSGRAATYGSKYVDFLPALQAAGDGSANDNSDIANGWVPRSLRLPGDGVHLTSTGYSICAGLMKDAHIANGYP